MSGSAASVSIDRREAYYERAKDLIAADPLWFYARAEQGRVIQAAMQPKDLTLERLKAMRRRLPTASVHSLPQRRKA